ncbi:hypothetical protein [Ensifer adhaerens]|uniref:hypothetical protein n=1 Tax=Ensifer adhaerens TaxID=106592 RepID=UPI000CF19BC0|nr:hypothetical protein [Ensifer adhaerens]
MNSVQTILAAFAISSTAFSAGPSLAAECDFQKPIGSCRGRITLDKIGGSKPSYSAEITVRSSAASCSKVEYYLDNTPHSTVLKNSSSAHESLFDAKPITRKNIQIERCTRYAEVPADAGRDSASGPEFFRGHWSGSAGILVFRGPVEVTIKSVSGNRASGFTYFPRDGSREEIVGTINGNALSYSYTNELGTMHITLTRNGPNSLGYRGVDDAAVITGSLTRR